MNVAGERSGPAERETATALAPEFYVALELAGDGQCCRPGLLYAPLTEAVVRVTATGAALATITVPRPYGTFTGVTAAADNRTFVLAAQELARLPLRTPPATRFFLLRIDPASRLPASRAQLTPLPIPEQPGRAVTGLALAPDATRLAVTAGPSWHPRCTSSPWPQERSGCGTDPGSVPGSARAPCTARRRGPRTAVPWRWSGGGRRTRGPAAGHRSAGHQPAGQQPARRTYSPPTRPTGRTTTGSRP